MVERRRIMPNHVTTRCVVTGGEVELKRFRDTFCCINDEGDFYVDFNKIIPMPAILINSVEGSIASTGLSLLLAEHGITHQEHELMDSQKEEIRKRLGMASESFPEVAEKFLAEYPEYMKSGIQRLIAIYETGYQSWYPWALANWGTKWNAYDCVLNYETEKYLEFCFNTAWSFPEPIFNKLAQLFPLLTLECDCYDEGGIFAGEGCFNPREGDCDFHFVEATPEIYERVYGYPYVPENDDVSVKRTDTSEK